MIVMDGKKALIKGNKFQIDVHLKSKPLSDLNDLTAVLEEALEITLSAGEDASCEEKVDVG